jgi:3-oxoacyl-[acyl-carrier protein] reductase
MTSLQNPRLAHKVALVTGASRGIGLAVAEAFGREGARVFMVGHQDEAALQAALARVRATGTEAVGGLYDVADPGAVAALADAIERAFGTLDVLVNNAGVLTPRPLLDITPEQFERTIKVHLCGSFHTLREMTNRFLKPKGKGKIINVTAPSALRASANVGDYASAKGGIIALTKSASRELAPFNIQVNAVSPVAETRMTQALKAMRGTDSGRVRPPPEAVAPTFVFLAGEESDYVSGQIIAADGGVTA